VARIYGYFTIRFLVGSSRPTESITVGRNAVRISRRVHGYHRHQPHPSIVRSTFNAEMAATVAIIGKRGPISAEVNITAPSMTVSITAKVPSVGLNTIEERVAWLEKESKTIRSELGDARSEFAVRTDDLRRELETERSERQRDSQAVSHRLEQGMVGDSHMEIAGVAFLVLGLLFANLAQDWPTGCRMSVYTSA
jgi:hypothetical protein